MCVEDYFNRFPTNFKEYLKINNNSQRFLKAVKFEYEDLDVYRGIHSKEGCVSREDFLCSLDDRKNFSLTGNNRVSMSSFSVSVNESIEMIEKTLEFPNQRMKLFALAKGKMRCKYGPADFNDNGRPHHNWYLYEGSSDSVVSDFEVIKQYG